MVAVEKLTHLGTFRFFHLLCVNADVLVNIFQALYKPGTPFIHHFHHALLIATSEAVVRMDVQLLQLRCERRQFVSMLPLLSKPLLLVLALLLLHLLMILQQLLLKL